MIGGKKEHLTEVSTMNLVYEFSWIPYSDNVFQSWLTFLIDACIMFTTYNRQNCVSNANLKRLGVSETEEQGRGEQRVESTVTWPRGEPTKEGVAQRPESNLQLWGGTESCALSPSLCSVLHHPTTIPPPREGGREWCWALLYWPPGPNMKQMWKRRSPYNKVGAVSWRCSTRQTFKIERIHLMQICMEVCFRFHGNLSGNRFPRNKHSH
ncbi:hypothetical protein JOB18_026423 [Solea senegalensis]|uniref:Uncharacterized protein n=1 Tax=Solea senegalensis TaxID=28829 RepID=A0AAV6SL10_SOLSE|nr:hypothetical protein JOB18_026423 [Solea senegalensis]